MGFVLALACALRFLTLRTANVHGGSMQSNRNSIKPRSISVQRLEAAIIKHRHFTSQAL